MHDPLVVAFEIKRPWPRSYSAKTIDGREVPAHRYWPSLITVWHREPGGHDSGDICKRRRRCHVHHWKIQIHSLQALRRRLLTRCAWCGGRSRKGDQVNVSHSWDGPRGHWWQGEPGLYHGDCSAISAAHATCVCEDPVLEYDGYGRCARCNAYRAWGASEEQLTRARELQKIPHGQRRPAAEEAR